MSTPQNVTLPNGKVVRGVDSEMSNAALLDQLSREGNITAEEAAQWGAGNLTGTEVPDTASMGSVGHLSIDNMQGMGGVQGEDFSEYGSGNVDAILGNMDVPGGIGGAIMGAKVGTPLGPLGILAGTVMGGAGGTFGGEILSDYFMGDQVDVEGAIKNAAIGAGVEVATLGAASKFKGVMKMLGFNGNEINQLWKTYTTKKAPKVGDEALPVGSPESLQQTQGFLEGGSGSLTAYQTGQQGATSAVMEGLGQIGVLSGRYYDDLNAKNARTIKERIDVLINDTMDDIGSDNIGASVHGVIQGGKQAAQANYSSGLNEIMSRIGTKQINPQWIGGTLKKFRKEGQKDFGSMYEPETLSLINEYQDVMMKMPTMSVDSLLAFQQKINAKVSQLGEFGMTKNTKAAQELAELSSRVRETTQGLLENVSPDSAKVYKELNAAYGEAMSGLLPKLNAGVITRADKGDYEAIARVLEGKSPDQIEAFMKSIDTAYTEAKIAGVDMAETAMYATPAQAKQAIQQGWLKNIFGDSTQGGFDPATFSRYASFYEKPANARAAKAILGSDFGTFKMLLNAMSEATERQTGFVGSLVLRSKEASAVSGLVQGGVSASLLPNIPVAATVFLGPMMLSKIASRPAAVRALLEGNKKAQAAKVAGRTAAFTEITEQTFGAIWSMLTPEEQIEVRENVRQGNE